jgi:predicted ArsR family transcriptional regulator
MKKKYSSAEKDEEKILLALADEYSRLILSAASKKELSAQQLSSKLRIPKATVYRKIRFLEKTGLLIAVKSVINHRGNEEKFYRSTVKKAAVHFEDGELKTKLELRREDSFVRLWKVFGGSSIKAVKK